ncbi:hypothetical protein HPB48_007374 [Haemaphysalis longicornis]|uniref:DDE-1 domain-containing protein n=1 Tax=Haemaphysalis longicornis TaxID=44386 RepID=A0A9J6G6F4_HAELO|nr:hypothetical protein HPB48_007374 [Haemaphysalis longicornis]
MLPSKRLGTDCPPDPLSAGTGSDALFLQARPLSSIRLNLATIVPSTLRSPVASNQKPGGIRADESWGFLGSLLAGGHSAFAETQQGQKPGRRSVTLAFSWITARSTKPPASSTNIELKFLPPNTTARLQPLDRSTKSFRLGYRRRLLDTLLMNLRVGTELKVDQLGPYTMMTGAWNRVKQSVANCFRKAACETATTTNRALRRRFASWSSLFPAAVSSRTVCRRLRTQARVAKIVRDEDAATRSFSGDAPAVDDERHTSSTVNTAG